MIELTRQVRFAVVDAGSEPPAAAEQQNSWSGWPASAHVVPQLSLNVTVAGPLDDQTGYVCNIRDIDQLVRRSFVEQVISNRSERAHPPIPEGLVRAAVQRLELGIPAGTTLTAVELRVSPFLCYGWRREEPAMVTVTQQFEFSAAHRLHSTALSDEENRRVFGKCNYPTGHGHNYVLEVTVAGAADRDGSIMSLDELNGIVKRLVIDRLDHRHLNHDVEALRGINPTVENIARAVWQWLDGQFGNVQLARVRLYETPKTWADVTRGDAQIGSGRS